MACIAGTDRTQAVLLPDVLDDFVRSDNPVRLATLQMMSGGRIEVCDNVRTAVDARHKLIVPDDVTNTAGDRDQLSPLATAAQEMLAALSLVVVADQGDYHGAEIKACLDRGRPSARIPSAP